MEGYVKPFGDPMPKECRTCIYGDTAAGGCVYLLVTGKSRIALHGGDYRNLLGTPCKERKAGRRRRILSATFRLPGEREGAK